MSDRETELIQDIFSGIHITIMHTTTIRTNPISYSKRIHTLRTAGGNIPAARTRLGGKSFDIEQPTPDPSAAQVAIGSSTWPERIYLQCENESSDGIEPYQSAGEITWCVDSIGEYDIPYVRADLVLVPPVAQAVAGPVVSGDELKALGRFRDCCEDFDAGGHDVSKPMMKRLAEIGLVRSVGFGRHETTEFGDFVLETPHSIASAQEIPIVNGDAMLAFARSLMPSPADLTDEQIEHILSECGGLWDGSTWGIEDADLHPFARTLIAKASLSATTLTDVQKAAPELLAALQTLVENGGIGPESMFHDARYAIKKATGNQS